MKSVIEREKDMDGYAGGGERHRMGGMVKRGNDMGMKSRSMSVSGDEFMYRDGCESGERCGG